MLPARFGCVFVLPDRDCFVPMLPDHFVCVTVLPALCCCFLGVHCLFVVNCCLCGCCAAAGSRWPFRYSPVMGCWLPGLCLSAWLAAPLVAASGGPYRLRRCAGWSVMTLATFPMLRWRLRLRPPLCSPELLLLMFVMCCLPSLCYFFSPVPPASAPERPRAVSLCVCSCSV